ncbi:hypothetical protein SporoP8_03440 [Sporosarcina ureae]|uniref:hypothetical protein n=1 Tax=Sporosarcina ureae TaxID=1571 RepID=UPI000A164F40|nr:hypothetical protein [Sporosarcina ureae]ARJ38029.1 hypothetical protein SporoP8_03440 [Sporosarcina ureae]
MAIAVPKYTQYQLSKLVNSKLNSMDFSLRDVASLYSVEEELVLDILGEQVRFKAKHYQVVSKIIGKSVDELLQDEEVKPISFRSVHDKEDDEITNKISNISNFFLDVALLKKLNGNIHV